MLLNVIKLFHTRWLSQLQASVTEFSNFYDHLSVSSKSCHFLSWGSVVGTDGEHFSGWFEKFSIKPGNYNFKINSLVNSYLTLTRA